MENKELSLKVLGLLKENKKEERFITLKEIENAIPGLQDKSSPHDKNMTLRQIIYDLNEESEYIIINKNYSYKIANEEEAKEYADNYFKNKIAPSLKRYWTMISKMKNDGKCKDLKENFIDTYMNWKGI